MPVAVPYYQNMLKSAKPIAYKDLGPEAIYKLEVKDFPLIVGIDAKGRNIYVKKRWYEDWDKIRKVNITRNYIKYAEGSCLIELGNTRVICTASVEETVPPFLKGRHRLGNCGIRDAAAFLSEPHPARQRFRPHL